MVGEHGEVGGVWGGGSSMGSQMFVLEVAEKKVVW
jgi:hypothetical protein